MAEWYYAVGDDRNGPISEEALQEQARNGVVTSDTLVWREGMADWIPFSRVAFSEDEAAAEGKIAPGVETDRCAYSGEILPKSEMIPYGDVWIAPQHKTAFVQQMMETTEAVPGDQSYLGGMQYVGFWWRFLAYFIDNMIVSIGSYVFMIPYVVVSVTADFDAETPFGSGAAIAAYILGVLGAIGLQIWYETWMVGRFQSTVGKMAIGAKVVSPTGEKVTYGRAFLRWLGKGFINPIIMYVIILIPIGIGLAIAIPAGGFDDPDSSPIVMVIIGFAVVLGLGLGGFPYYMAGWDPEKRALHDRMFSTRVIKK
jgi:uncharacterized RDD family membrane protein YckC